MAAVKENSMSPGLLQSADASQETACQRVPSSEISDGGCEPGTDPPLNRRGSSFIGSSLNVSNAALGAGILLFPQTFARNGIALGVASLLVAAFVMGFTLHVLIIGARASNGRNFQDTVAKLVHPLAGKGVSITMSLYLFGTCASYLLLVVDQLCAVFDWDKNVMRLPILLVSGAIVFAMMIPRDITALQRTSAFGVATNCYVALDILFESCRQVQKNGAVQAPVMWNPGSPLASAFATYAFSLQCHLIFIPVYWGMGVRGVRKQNGVTFFAYTLCVLLYGSVGIVGYLAYGKDVASDVLADNLPRNAGTDLARICLALKSLVSYPLLHFPARLCLGDLVVGDDILLPKYRKQYFGCTLFFLFLTTFIAYAVDNLGALIDLVSSLLGVFQVFVWPGCVWIAVRKKRRSEVVAICVGILLICIGFLVTAFGVMDTVQNEFLKHKDK